MQNDGQGVKLVDKREIQFNGDALVYCLSASPRAAEGFGLPPIPPAGVRFFPADRMIDALYGRNDTLWAARIPAESLGALLISYCIRARIPMPRVAEKRVRVEADRIILEFLTRFSRVPAPENPESSSRAAQAVKSLKWVEPPSQAGR